MDTKLPETRTGDDVRESMPRLVALTLLTGKPFAGERPRRFTPTGHLVNALASTAAGVTISVLALQHLPLLLLVGWAMTLHGMRNLRMMIFHQCAHRNMWRRKRLDQAVGRALAALLVVQQFDRYQAEHVADHHAVHHMTLRDPTVQAMLVSLELRPGMSRAEMWRTVLGKLVSPAFHLRFATARVRSYIHSAGPKERAGAATALVALLATVHVLDAWPELLVAWVLPLTVFFQISNTLRLCVKHTFPAREESTRRGREYFASLTNAIFLGERAPERGAGAWAKWWARMVFVHFPSRYLVLTGDTVCHDFHHRHPIAKDWANYIWAREADIGNGPPYRHVWGLGNAIDVVFASLAKADPEEYDAKRLEKVSRRELFAAFDD